MLLLPFCYLRSASITVTDPHDVVRGRAIVLCDEEGQCRALFGLSTSFQMSLIVLLMCIGVLLVLAAAISHQVISDAAEHRRQAREQAMWAVPTLNPPFAEWRPERGLYTVFLSHFKLEVASDARCAPHATPARHTHRVYSAATTRERVHTASSPAPPPLIRRSANNVSSHYTSACTLSSPPPATCPLAGICLICCGTRLVVESWRLNQGGRRAESGCSRHMHIPWAFHFICRGFLSLP